MEREGIIVIDTFPKKNLLNGILYIQSVKIKNLYSSKVIVFCCISRNNNHNHDYVLN